MAGRFETTTPQILRHLKRGTSERVHKAAHRVLYESNRLAPFPGHSRGYSVGALIASGYVSSAKLGTKEYDAAIALAASVPGTRIEDRDQILPPTVPYDSGDSVTALVDYPLTYARLMETGFWHEGAQTFIPGSYFLYDATVRVAAEFNRSFYQLLDEIKAIRVLTPREKVLARREAREEADARWNERINREAAAQVRSEQADLRNLFFASYGHEILQREKGRVKGYSTVSRKRDMQGKLQSGGARIRVRYGMETAGERDERVESLYQEWLASRNDFYNY